MNPLQIATQFIVPLMLWREARNCSQEARRGILHVLFNRQKHPAGPYKSCKSILDHILCPKQFSSFNTPHLDANKKMIAGDSNSWKLPNPLDPMEWKAFEGCVDVCQEPGSDPTNGADAYHSYSQGDPNWPKWAVLGAEIAKIGPFWFYRLYK